MKRAEQRERSAMFCMIGMNSAMDMALSVLSETTCDIIVTSVWPRRGMMLRRHRTSGRVEEVAP